MAEEKRFELRVRKWLEAQGVFEAGTAEQDLVVPVRGWYFKVWGGGYQKAGIPDLIANINGFFVAIELKSSAGRPSELQRKNITLINRGNGIGVVLYPSGFDWFKRIVEGVLQCNLAIPALNALKLANASTKCDTLIR